jgi:hypothetical protein
MPPAVFEPAVSASERPQTHALGLAATGIPAFPGVPKYLCSQEADERSPHNARSLFLLFAQQLRRILLRAVKKWFDHTVFQRRTVSLMICVMYDLCRLSSCDEFFQELLKFERN